MHLDKTTEVEMVSGERIQFLSAVLLTSSDPERLASFYREVLGVPLKEERHGNAPQHFGCELGDIHFAIHPTDVASAAGPIRLAFWVFDLPGFVERLKGLGVEPLSPIRPLGPTSSVTALRDPDGNEIELTQMGQDWVDHLESQRSNGADVVQAARLAVAGDTSLH
ncbi:MAG TPA: VOC family protein [Acidimicrobiales bacterium]|jgi:predicted enzyme related to lactoylglutathione lyase